MEYDYPAERDTRYRTKKASKSQVKTHGHSELKQVSDTLKSSFDSTVVYSLDKRNRWEIVDSGAHKVKKFQRDMRRGDCWNMDNTAVQVLSEFNERMRHRYLPAAEGDFTVQMPDTISAHRYVPYSSTLKSTERTKNSQSKHRKSLRCASNDLV
eukprot:GILK01001491.1.p1 GENE.GILK01001491.1~~GILK01001491.1.p1  ORF type:complete len:154 (+),score=19.69 GILK01001491.1:82-543(+)